MGTPLAAVHTKPKTVWTPEDVIDRPCPTFGAYALVLLKGKLLAEQPDGTNIVGSPGFAGCNCGFEMPALNMFGQQS